MLLSPGVQDALLISIAAHLDNTRCSWIKTLGGVTMASRFRALRLSCCWATITTATCRRRRSMYGITSRWTFERLVARAIGLDDDGKELVRAQQTWSARRKSAP